MFKESLYFRTLDFERVQQKITAYVNIGQTVAPQEILDYLSARCEANLGDFATSEESE